jgi:hypothetical protein
MLRRHCCSFKAPQPSRTVQARLFPKLARDFDRVDAGRLPPLPLIARAMSGTVMSPAERDSKFVARLTAKRAWLHKTKMMGIRRLAAADNTGLRGYEPKMSPISIATWLGDCEDALVDALGSINCRNNSSRVLPLDHAIVHHFLRCAFLSLRRDAPRCQAGFAPAPPNGAAPLSTGLVTDIVKVIG